MGERGCCLVREGRLAGAVKLCFKCEKDNLLDKLNGISEGRLLFFWCSMFSHVVLGKGDLEFLDDVTRVWDVGKKLANQYEVERDGPFHSAHVLGGIQCPGFSRSKLEDGITYKQVGLELCQGSGILDDDRDDVRPGVFLVFFCCLRWGGQT